MCGQVEVGMKNVRKKMLVRCCDATHERETNQKRKKERGEKENTKSMCFVLSEDFQRAHSEEIGAALLTDIRWRMISDGTFMTFEISLSCCHVDDKSDLKFEVDGLRKQTLYKIQTFEQKL